MFGTKGWSSVFSPNAAILISMLSTAYMAHYNAPKFYWELRNKAAYNSVVIKSFGWAMVLMSVMATAGYLTFGAASQSLILNNYSGSADTLIALSRMAVTLSLIFTYPLAFVGVRDGFLDLINVPIEKRTRTVSDMWTIVWLTIITGLAYTLTDIRVILSLGGATWGNLLVYVFPALMIVRGAASSNSNVKRELLPKVALSRATGLLGVVMGVVGTVKAIQAL